MIFVYAAIVLACFVVLFFALEVRRRAYGGAIADAYEERIANLKYVYESRIEGLAKHERERNIFIASQARVLQREIDRAEGFRAAATFLWDRLDDIDTLDDECRNNHMKFRERVRTAQKRRTEVATSDGYGLTWKHLIEVKKENP